MRRQWVITIASFILSVAIVSAQTGQCTEIIETAIANAEEGCSSIGRNQACFGHIALDATGQPDADNFQFSNIGDIVDVAEIETLTLGGFNSDTGAWGVVLMRLQANLPDTLPGQNVTVILFGDTTLRNAASSVAQQIPPEQQQTISATGAVNIRSLPTTTASVLGSVNSGVNITATGRTSDNQWIRTLFDEQPGWIASFLLSGDSRIEDLLVVEPDAEQFGPMQAFYLTTGIGRPGCKEIPDNGMMVQTPQGVGTINLTVNEVDIEMGSTVYFTINDDRMMSVQPIEGAARVTSGGMTRTAIAGTRTQIQLNDDYLPEGEPSIPESYFGDEDIDDLPYEALEREIEWDEGLDDEEYEDFLEYDEIFESLDLEDLDEVFDYIAEYEDDEEFNLLDYIIDDLDYVEFDDELEDYFLDEGYDFSGYDEFTGDDDGSDDYDEFTEDDDSSDGYPDDSYPDDDYPHDDGYPDDSYPDDDYYDE